MERRRGERRSPDSTDPLAQVRLRTGRELSVLDVSDSGVLVEGGRLLPGTHVDVHVTTRDGRVLVRSRIVRAHVAALEPNAIRYRTALAFERMVDTSIGAGYGMPMPGTMNHVEQGTNYPTNVTPSAA